MHSLTHSLTHLLTHSLTLASLAVILLALCYASLRDSPHFLTRLGFFCSLRYAAYLHSFYFATVAVAVAYTIHVHTYVRPVIVAVDSRQTVMRIVSDLRVTNTYMHRHKYTSNVQIFVLYSSLV